MCEYRFLIKAPLAVAAERFQKYENLELTGRGEWTLGEDFSGTELFGWEVSDWKEAAGEFELIYASYDESGCSGEYIHIRDGAVLRAYQVFEGTVDVDEGDAPAISGWEDVAARIGEWMRGEIPGKEPEQAPEEQPEEQPES